MADTVAVAGGTGGLGRAIVDAIVASGDFEVLILSRTTDESRSQTSKSGSRIVSVDYNDLDNIKQVLEENNVTTVISTLNLQLDITPELNLIKAAENSKTTRRFIPSIWVAKYIPQETDTIHLAKTKKDIYPTLEATSLEYSAWYVGLFLDYWVMPHAPSYMRPFPYAIDIENRRAALPGQGNVPIVFNYTLDIAKFVTASLKLPHWDKETYVINDKLTFNEFLQAAEDATDAKFDVTYDPIELPQSGKTNALPPTLPEGYSALKDLLEGYMASVGVMIENGEFDFKPSRTINETFPDIKVRRVNEFLKEVWGKK
ncbi:hypothetical protein BKA66DRAFT_575730 [Pyrenochaeta sp. MPI-SDFR-AT-0127]|nr:hypothetical protein BKA66DRAFT_575730 [Pyrenochaeta sp. MPI-SDFR-AT-0127]